MRLGLLRRTSLSNRNMARSDIILGLLKHPNLISVIVECPNGSFRIGVLMFRLFRVSCNLRTTTKTFSSEDSCGQLGWALGFSHWGSIENKDSFYLFSL